MTALAEVDTSYRQAPDALDLGHIPGNHGLPVLGETLAVLRDLHAVAVRHLREYGPVSRIRLAGQGGLLVMGAEHFERIFHDPEQCFSAEKGYDRQLGIFYPRGLLLMDFDEHRANRRMMQGAFKVPALQRYIAMMQPVIERHVREWGRDERIVFYPRIKQLAGGDRQAIHEVIRQNSLATAEEVSRGEPNRLLDRLAADHTFAKIPTATLSAELDPARYTGRSAEQVGEFLEEYLRPLVARARPLAAAVDATEIRV